jgi:hypothetical protein
MPIARVALRMRALPRAAPALVAALAAFPLCGCYHWAEVRVRDPDRVGVYFDSQPALPENSGATSVAIEKHRPLSPDLPVVVERRDDRSVVLDVPYRAGPFCGLWGACEGPPPMVNFDHQPVDGTEETLVAPDGRVLASAYVPGADSVDVRGDAVVMRHVYARYWAGYPRHTQTRPLEVWMKTPVSNVETIEAHKSPIRGFGIVALLVATPFAIGAVALSTNRDSNMRAFGGVMLGIPAFVLGGAGVALLTWPETTSVEHPSQDVAAR